MNPPKDAQMTGALPDNTSPPLSGDEHVSDAHSNEDPNSSNVNAPGLSATIAVASFAVEQNGPGADGHPEADALARHQGSGQEDPEAGHAVEQDGLGRQEAHDQAPCRRARKAPKCTKHVNKIPYNRILEQAKVLSHIKDGHVWRRSRHNKGNITMIDYITGHSSPRVRHCLWEMNPGETGVYYGMKKDDFFKALQRKVSKSVKTRLLLVEDLSKEIILGLGHLYDVSPEFFEEHLVNSGYNDGRYQDPAPQTWITYGMRKNYASVRWFRPAHRLDSPPFSNRSEEDLLSAKPLAYSSGEKKGPMTIYKTETNIFRSKWDLSTDPGMVLSERRPCGWEERASVWSKLINGCRISTRPRPRPQFKLTLSTVILLLDPLPTLKRGMNERVEGDEWTHEDWFDIENLGSDSENSDHGTADPDQGQNEATHLGGDVASLTSTNLRRRSRPVAKNRIYILDWLNKIFNRGKAKEERPHYTRFKPSQSEVPIIEDIGLRVTFDITYEELFSSNAGLSMLNQRFRSSKSTKVHFMKLISVPSHPKRRELYPLGAIVPLVEIIAYDSLSLCKLIYEVLDEIRQDMVDETKLEERLVLWRQFLRRCQRELSQLQPCILHFCNVIHSVDPIPLGNFAEDSSHLSFTGTSDDFCTINDVLKRIGHLADQAGTVSKMLTSNMSLLESKRSIAEAKSIAKLTELAFLFIPLTFSATLFGMQVEQFNDRAPLSTFIAVALATTTISYGIRLLIRSQWVVSLRRVATTRIQMYAKRKKVNIRRGQPTSFLIGWTIFEGQRAGYSALKYIYRIFKVLLRRFLDEIDLVIIGSVGVSIIAAPIAVLWTRSIDIGVKIIITVILLLLMLTVVLVYSWAAFTPAQKKAFFRILRGEVMQFKSSSSILRAAFWFMTITILAVPLCVLWTRELEVSIKVAFTVVIVLFVMIGWITFGIYKLINAARDDASSRTSSIAKD